MRQIHASPCGSSIASAFSADPGFWHGLSRATASLDVSLGPSYSPRIVININGSVR